MHQFGFEASTAEELQSLKATYALLAQPPSDTTSCTQHIYGKNRIRGLMLCHNMLRDQQAAPNPAHAIQGTQPPEVKFSLLCE
jgi:hypothetical protein